MLTLPEDLTFEMVLDFFADFVQVLPVFRLSAAGYSGSDFPAFRNSSENIYSSSFSFDRAAPIRSRAARADSG